MAMIALMSGSVLGVFTGAFAWLFLGFGAGEAFGLYLMTSFVLAGVVVVLALVRRVPRATGGLSTSRA